MYFGPITTIFLRLLISSVILLIFTFIIIRPVIQLKHLRLFIAAALFEPFFYFLGESYGMKWVTPVTASIIVATIPLFTTIAGKILFNEKLSRKNIVGIFISFLGVCMVIFSAGFNIQAHLIGVILMFVAVFSAVGYAIALRRLTPLYNPITIIALQNTFGMFMFLPFLLIFENPLQTFNNITMTAFIPIMNLGIFASSLAFILYAFAVSHIGIGRSSVFTNLIPIFTAIFSYFIINETFNVLKIVGILTVIMGLVFSQWEIIFKKIFISKGML